MVDLPRRITDKDHVIAEKLKGLWIQKQKEMDLTQAEAAQELNITQSAFSQMLNCKVAIPTEMILKIAMLFSESPTRIDKDFYKRFDIKSNKRLKEYLAIEIAKLSASDQADLMETANVRTNKRKGTG